MRRPHTRPMLIVNQQRRLPHTTSTGYAYQSLHVLFEALEGSGVHSPLPTLAGAASPGGVGGALGPCTTRGVLDELVQRQ